MYQVKTGQVKADDGTEFTMKVMHVNISPEVAREVFDRGIETGNWNWKEKVWTCANIVELRQIIAAARFYYGWKDGSEKVYQAQDGDWIFTAYYAC